MARFFLRLNIPDSSTLTAAGLSFVIPGPARTKKNQGLADWLESVGVVENDRQIVSWDGARLRKDSARPRTEVLLSPVMAQVDGAASEGSNQ